jgi:hypothetical protein
MTKSVPQPQQGQSQPEPAPGQVPAGDYQPVQQSQQEGKESQEGQKSVEDVAREVIAGHWGRGQKREKRLKDAGYDSAAVDEEVTRIFNR